MSDATERDDEHLLVAIADGDRGALTMLYRRHAPWLLLRLARRCSDPEVVDMALQDTFVAVWRKPLAYERRGDVAAWIWGIAIRRLIDQLRRRPMVVISAAREDVRASTEEEVLLRVEHGDLAGSLDRLSPELPAWPRPRWTGSPSRSSRSASTTGWLRGG